jgi:hypothetical protein
MQPDNEEMHRFTMQVDGVTHGKQFVRRDKWMNGTAYYGPQCGAARAIRYAQQRAGRPIRIGGVGMGVGTLAVYTRPGDLMRFYEINPACEVFARKYFHFLDASPGETEVILGDARVCLERELASGKPQRYDVLALDAFSGHAVPSHLLTVEAFEVYKRHLKSNAIIAVHISNHYLDLAPVVFAAARHNGYGVTLIENRPDWDEQVQASSWVLMSKDQRFIETHPMELCPDEGEPPRDEIRELPAWTDARSSLYEILRWK